MTACKQLIEQINAGGLDEKLASLYGAAQVANQRARYIRTVEGYLNTFGEAETLQIFSAPGRTEIGGNHTDHNHGKVVAAAVNMDVIAIVCPTDDGVLKIQSEGYRMDVVDTADLSVREAERNKSVSLVRGTAAGFQKEGLRCGGFCAYTTSNVLKGSGLSSSAAFEVLVGTILNHLYNGGAISAVKIAQLAQYAERDYFGKPCGLMDQMASSVGGIIAIDFADTEHPVLEKLDFDFASADTALCIVDVGGDHADLTDEYAAIPQEMHAIAEQLGVSFLRETDSARVLEHMPVLRQAAGDRAVLRALHFFMENRRVERMVAALKAGDFRAFEREVTASGASSYMYLQNVYVGSAAARQPMSIALCLSENLLGGQGAFRVHGGGFGGTIQAFVPKNLLDEYRQTIESVFGENSCHVLSVRQQGGVKVQ